MKSPSFASPYPRSGGALGERAPGARQARLRRFAAGKACAGQAWGTPCWAALLNRVLLLWEVATLLPGWWFPELHLVSIRIYYPGELPVL